MKLTGKAKVEFEKWLSPKNLGILHFTYPITDFYVLPKSMQFGVYVDFADSLEYPIYLDPVLILIGETTRPEARTAAIEKFNELLNERLCKDISK